MCTDGYISCSLVLFLYVMLTSIAVIIVIYATENLLPRLLPTVYEKWYNLGYTYMYIIIDSVVSPYKDKGFLLQPLYKGMRDCLKSNWHLLSENSNNAKEHK